MTLAPWTSTDLHIGEWGRPAGEAPVMVLLHGFTGMGEAWTDAILHWRDRFHIVTPDARGHGRSPRFTAAELMEPDFAVMRRDAIALLEHIRRTTGRPADLLLGHSMGARVAAEAAEDRPDLVARLAVEDPPWYWPDPFRPVARSLKPVAAAFTADQAEAEAATLRTLLPPWPADIVATSSRSPMLTDPGFAGRDVGPERDWRDTVARLAVPTLIVAGDHGIIDAERLAMIHRLNPALQTVVVPHAGHGVRRDNPTGYFAAIDAFLR